MDEGPSRKTSVGLGLPPPDSEGIVHDDNLTSLAAAYQLHVLQTSIPLATDDVVEVCSSNQAISGDLLII